MVPERASEIENTVRAVLRDVLGLSAERVAAFDEETPLFGALPELDSMAVVQLIGALEDHFGFGVDDDEISAANFATLGSLAAFVRFKLTA